MPSNQVILCYPLFFLPSKFPSIRVPFSDSDLLIGDQNIGVSASALQMNIQERFSFCSVQFSSVAQSCLTLCDPMNLSMPGLPVHHQLLEFIQTHVHRISDAIGFNLFVVQGTRKSLLHTTVQKHQFYGAHFSLYSNFHIHT